MGKMYSIALIIIPVFLLFSAYVARYAGDKEIDRLSAQVNNIDRANIELKEKNSYLSKRVDELIKYEGEAKTQAMRVKELEDVIKALRGTDNQGTSGQ